jgi:hypothetical protein
MPDPFFRLRPQPPTPEDELCDCRQANDIYLAHKLGSNPLYCLSCNGEVAPERLGFGEALAERIARWNTAYGALYALWLDSGEYEPWAKEKLMDIKGQVSRDGLEVVRELGAFAKTYYLWFYEDKPPATCPACGAPLHFREDCKRLLCDRCHIIT